MIAQSTEPRRVAGWRTLIHERDRHELVTLALVVAVVVSSFLGHYGVAIAGYNVRVEQVIPLLLVRWPSAWARTRADLFRALTHPVVLVFGAFIAWNVVATLMFSPSLGKSASILVWLVIDLLLLAGVISLACARYGLRTPVYVGSFHGDWQDSPRSSSPTFRMAASHLVRISTGCTRST